MEPKESKEDQVEEKLDTHKYMFLNEVQEQVESNSQNPEEMEFLKSKRSWEDLGLKKELIELLQVKGFKKPSVVQSKVILLSKKLSVVGQAQNGSGKTLSFLIPCLQSIDPQVQGSINNMPSPQVIIIGDTKALLVQVHRIMRDLLDNYEGYNSVTSDFIFGGKPQPAENTQVLLTTIVQLKKIILKKEIILDNLKWLVIDEADSVFSSDVGKNFAKQLFNKHLSKIDYKFIMTSATMTDDFRDVIANVDNKKNYGKFELPVEQLTLKNVYQFMIMYENKEQKLQVLKNLIENLNVQNILIFGNNKKRLDELKQFLISYDHKVSSIYSSNQGDRNQAEFLEQQMKDFLAGKYRILLTTNLLSRGIDMRKVTLVINFELPLRFFEDKQNNKKEVDVETYLHRVGRTGRFGDQGIAINLVDKNKDIALIEHLRDYYKTNKMQELDSSHLKQVNEILGKIQEQNQIKRQQLEENIQFNDLKLS